MSCDEAAAEANAASPRMRLSSRSERAPRTRSSALSLSRSPRRLGATMAFLFEPLLRYGPRASWRLASLVSRGGGSYFPGSVAFFREDAQPASIDGPQPGGERAEILRMVHQMPTKSALSSKAEAGHAQSPSAKEATALEGLKRVSMR